MTNHDEMMGACGTPVLMDQHGRSVVYTPAGGEGVTITALVGPEVTGSATAGSDGRQRQPVRTLTVSLADVAAPARYDTVAIGGDTWKVEWPENAAGGWARLRLVLVARHG